MSSDSHAQNRDSQRLQSYSADRTFWVTDFSAASEVSSFTIEGVSLETPFDEIREILEERGYEEEFTPSLLLKFVKSTGNPRDAGSVTYQIEVNDRDGGRYLRFMRSTTDGPVSSSDSTLWSTQPLPSSEDVEKVRSLKSIICDGIPDETEQWRLCPPNVDDEASLSMGRFGITLVDGLVVEVLHAKPLYTVIQLRRRP